MSDVKTWSQTAAENSDPVPDYGPEGHARTQVNNISREAQAAVRRQWETMAWFDKTKGPSGLGFTLTRLGDFQVNLVHQTTPTDASGKFLVGARVRVGDGATYVYGYILTAVYANPNTVVTLDLDGATVVQTTPTILELNVTDGTVGKAAFSTTGTTTGQDPPQIPTIDDLGDGALLDQGPDNGFDADTVDGFHATDLIDAAAGSAGIGLINGNFEIGQRGHALTPTTDFPTDNAAYVADGWALLMGEGTAHPAGGSGVVDVDLIASGASLGKADAKCIRLTGNANVGIAPVEKVGLIQWLPNDVVDQLEGTVVSLSVWARRPSGTDFDQIRIGIVCWSGTADTLTSVDPINDWGAVGVTPTMLASYTLFESESALPLADWSEHLLENITLPVGTNNVGVMIWTDDTTWSDTKSIDFTGVRLVKGATAQTYSHEEFAENLLRCQRFFNSTFEEGDLVQSKGGDEATALRVVTNSGSRTLMSWEFGTSMFKAPTIVTYNPSATGTGVTLPWNLETAADGALTATDASKRRVGFLVTSAAADDRMVMHATAEAVL